MAFLSSQLLNPVAGLAGGALGGVTNGLLGDLANPTPLTNPVNQGQVNKAYELSQGGLQQQQDFLSALQAQNGIQNQSQVYNQLQGIANGTGPNPALAQLNQSTGANIQGQAALIAGQRGAGANPALIARQAAMQGGALQQAGVGQAATLQAQQQQAAINAAGQLASQQVGQQNAATQGYSQSAQNEQANILGAVANQNNANLTNEQNVRGIKAGVLGGVAQGAGQAAMMAEGGEVPAPQAPMHAPVANTQASGPRSFVGQYFTQSMNPAPLAAASVPAMAKGGPVQGEMLAAQGKMVPGKASVKGDSLKNDTVDAKLSPGEVVIPRSVMQSSDPVSNAAKFVQAIMAKNKGMRK